MLVRNNNGSVYGVTYKWRPDNSDADLLSSSLSEDIVITNATGVRTQTWYYPSPSDCLECHNTAVAGNSYGIGVLGVNTRQLNGNQTYPATGVTDNQIRTLNRLGLFNPAINETNISGYYQLSAMTNLSARFRTASVRIWTPTAQQCHQPGGTGHHVRRALRHAAGQPEHHQLSGVVLAGNFRQCLHREIQGHLALRAPGAHEHARTDHPDAGLPKSD